MDDVQSASDDLVRLSKKRKNDQQSSLSSSFSSLEIEPEKDTFKNYSKNELMSMCKKYGIGKLEKMGKSH